MIKQRMKTGAHGEPILTITIVGAHDIVRFADRMTEWQCEFGRAGRLILAKVRRRMRPGQWDYMEKAMFGRKLPCR